MIRGRSFCLFLVVVVVVFVVVVVVIVVVPKPFSGRAPPCRQGSADIAITVLVCRSSVLIQIGSIRNIIFPFSSTFIKLFTFREPLMDPRNCYLSDLPRTCNGPLF